VTAPAKMMFWVLAGVIAVRMLAGRHAEKRAADDEGVAGLNAEAFRLLIEGEQKLLALFDARQASADTKMTAALTGALALPTATLALANPLKADETLLKVAYAAIAFLVIVILVMRFGSGIGRRNAERAKREELGGRPKKKLSTESLDAALARDAWWKCEATADPLTVQALALELWRTRAKHSRDIAQVKDRAAAIAAAAFVFALIISAILVIRAEFNPHAPVIGT
jgi:hypothetical protein